MKTRFLFFPVFFSILCFVQPKCSVPLDQSIDQVKIEQALINKDSSLAKDLLEKITDQQMVSWSKISDMDCNSTFRNFLQCPEYRERLMKLNDEAFVDLMCDCKMWHGGIPMMHLTSRKDDAITHQFWNRIKQLPKDMKLKILNADYLGMQFMSFLKHFNNELKLPSDVRSEIYSEYESACPELLKNIKENNKHEVETILANSSDEEVFAFLQQNFDYCFYGTGTSKETAWKKAPMNESRELLFQRFLKLSDKMVSHCAKNGSQQELSYGFWAKSVFAIFFDRNDFRERICKLNDEDFKTVMQSSGGVCSCDFTAFELVLCSQNILQFWNRVKQLPKEMIHEILNRATYNNLGIRMSLKYKYFEIYRQHLSQDLQDQIDAFYKVDSN